MKQARASGQNLRAAVEATVREISCRLNHANLRVRGQSRVSMTLLAAAAMVNIRRIWRHQQVGRKSYQQAVVDSSGSNIIIDEEKTPFSRLFRRLDCKFTLLSSISGSVVNLN